VFSSAGPVEVKDCTTHKNRIALLNAISLKCSYRVLVEWEEAFIIATNDVPVLYINNGLHVSMYQTSTFEDSDLVF